jgi:hypothetical protein
LEDIPVIGPQVAQWMIAPFSMDRIKIVVFAAAHNSPVGFCSGIPYIFLELMGFNQT